MGAELTSPEVVAVRDELSEAGPPALRTTVPTMGAVKLSTVFGNIIRVPVS